MAVSSLLLIRNGKQAVGASAKHTLYINIKRADVLSTISEGHVGIFSFYSSPILPFRRITPFHDTSFFFLGVIARSSSCSITLLALLGLRTATSTSSCSPASSTATGSTTALAARRGTHEGKVDLDRLVEEFRLVGSVDGGAGFFKRRVLDQRIALSPC